MTAVPIRLDIVSDVVCPWCAIGLAALERALANIGDVAAADIQFHPLELNPDMPAEGQAIGDHLARKYGASPQQARATGGCIRDAAAEVGVAMTAHRDRIYGTFDAHRLLHWAQLEGRPMALKHALFDAYFERGDNVSDADVLVAAAGRAGLDEDGARDVLREGRYADEVRAAERYWRSEGITSVPTIVLDGRFVIAGAQGVERLEKAIRRRVEDVQTA